MTLVPEVEFICVLPPDRHPQFATKLAAGELAVLGSSGIPLFDGRQRVTAVIPRAPMLIHCSEKTTAKGH